MRITVRQDILEKIRNAENGDVYESLLLRIINKPNASYQRGILHGFLLTLSELGVIRNDEALDILEQALTEAEED